MALPSSILQAGLRSAQPAASAANVGQMYRVTDEGNLLEQSTGSAWVAVGAGGIGPGGVTLEEVEALIAAASLGGAAQRSFLVSGGEIAWQEDYVFAVAAASYYINGVLFASAADTVTLDPSDATLDRVDVIALDNAGAVVVVTGTAAAQPSEPDIDPGTQLKLGFVQVAAASTEPDVTSALIYADNAGPPTEWAWTTSGSGFNVNSTNNPRSPSTKCIEGTTVAAAAYAQGEAAAPFDPTAYATLVLYLRSKATWSNNRGLSLTWRLQGVLLGQAVTIERTGTFGFLSSNTTDYQSIAIPMSVFAIAPGSTVDQLRVTDFGGSIGFYLDDVSLQVGAVTQPPTGLTQDQADARYRRLSVPLSLASAADVTGDLPLANLAPASAASRLLGRGSASGAGDYQEITLGSGVTLTGTVLSATGSGGTGDVVGPASSVASEVVLFDGTTGKLIKAATGTGIVRVSSGVYGTPGAVNLASEVTGDLPLANLAPASAASKLLGRGAGSGAGDFQEITLGTNLSMSGSTLNAAGGGGSGDPYFVGITVWGDELTAGFKGAAVAKLTGTITAWYISANPGATGTVEFDITLDNFGTYPPTTSIVASAPPELSGADSATDSALSGWSPSVTAGQRFGFSIVGTPSGLDWVTLQVLVTP